MEELVEGIINLDSKSVPLCIVLRTVRKMFNWSLELIILSQIKGLVYIFSPDCPRLDRLNSGVLRVPMLQFRVK